MLAVVATALGCCSVLLVEASIVYYRHPRSPAWLRSRPNLQTSISTLFGCGLMALIAMFVRFVLDSGYSDLRFGELALIVGLIAAFLGLFRLLRNIGKALVVADKDSASAVAFGDFSRYEPLSRSLPPSNDRKAA